MKAMAKWSAAEVQAIVGDYLAMLETELRRQPYSKAEHRRELMKHLNGRTPSAIELKHQNISAVLNELGAPAIEGYVPLYNYQQTLPQAVAEEVKRRPSLLAVLAEDVKRSPAVPPADDILAARADPPKPRPRRKQAVRKRGAIGQGAAGLPRNWLELEAANQNLGANGEEFIVRYERSRLVSLRLEHLADKVERVSLRDNGLGFDILSFNESEAEIHIEVKTTKYGEYTPFYASRNEVATSLALEKTYQLYRVYDFGTTTRFFAKPGHLMDAFDLAPFVYEARIR